MSCRILILLIVILTVTEGYGQCSCITGAGVGGLTPVTGSANVGVLRSGYLRGLAFYSYLEGNDYLAGTTIINPKSVKNYNVQFLDILLSYGLTNKLTLETELGYFLRKFQQFEDYNLKSDGLSHISFYLKYNVFHSILNDLELSVGSGLRLPFNSDDENLPQHLLPSNGAYGINLQLFLQKGFKEINSRLLFVNRSDYSFENNLEYQYGLSIYNSLIYSVNIVENLFGFIELRNEYRLKDKLYGEIIDDTGSNVFLISPQINYWFSNLNVSIVYNYPFYRNYNGEQLANDYSIGLIFSYQTKIGD